MSVWAGDVAAGDVEQHLIGIAEDPDWPPGPLHLTDLRMIGTASIPDRELVELLYEGTRLEERIKVAVVVRPELHRKPGLRFASAAKEINAATFADLDAACGYLGVSADVVAQVLAELRAQLGASDARS